MLLPLMPYRLPSTPYLASWRSQRLRSFLCPTIYLRPWGIQVTKADPVLAFSDQLLGLVVVGCTLVGLEVVAACFGPIWYL